MVVAPAKTQIEIKIFSLDVRRHLFCVELHRTGFSKQLCTLVISQFLFFAIVCWFYFYNLLVFLSIAYHFG